MFGRLRVRLNYATFIRLAIIPSYFHSDSPGLTNHITRLDSFTSSLTTGAPFIIRINAAEIVSPRCAAAESEKLEVF